jgi:gamma-glutamyltranspeptidase/glutathione hydrolase
MRRCRHLWALSTYAPALAVFAAALLVCSSEVAVPQAAAARGLVVSFHPQATDAGVQMLTHNGNAFDAFVAATLAEYVVDEGGTSPAGSLGALIYDAKTKTTQYLDSEFNGVLDPKGGWDFRKPWSAADSEAGKAVLVPGAIAGLEALSKRYGRKSFSDALQPAIALAKNGFTVQGFYRASLVASADFLKQNPYAARTFYPNGRAIASGQVLRQPELAVFLEGLAREGAAYMYSGAWADECVAAVRAHGGRLTKGDLSAYRAVWRDPWTIQYRGFDVQSASGRAFGSLWDLVALKTLEHANVAKLGHPSTSADALELMVRTARETLAEPWLFDYRRLDQPAFVRSKLTSAATQPIYDRVAAATRGTRRGYGGTHSYQIIVVDAEGNAVTGTNTHESLAWGSGTFVQGVPLNTAGRIPWATKPGDRQLSPFSVHLVFKDKKLRAASGAFAGSLLEGEFQFLVNVMDYGLSAADAVSRPRFGTFPYDPAAALANSIGGRLAAASPNWLDARVSADIVQTLKKRGLNFEQRPSASGWVDTAMGSVVVISADGTPEGANTSWADISGPPGSIRTVPAVTAR